MTAQDVQVSSHKARRLTLPLASGQYAAQGATAIGDPATGTVKSGPSLVGGLLLGVFHAKADASAAQAPCDVDFLEEITILYRANDGSITSANLFSDCFVVDDRQVALTDGSGTRALAGTILIVDPVDGVGFAVGRSFLQNK